MKTARTKVSGKVSKTVQARRKLIQAQKRKKPAFKRQHWFRYKKLGEDWRRPKGNQSEFRMQSGERPKRVKVGFGAPRSIKGLHPSGYEEIIVHNMNELVVVNTETQAVKFSATLGGRKRKILFDKAKALNVKILNP